MVALSATAMVAPKVMELPLSLPTEMVTWLLMAPPSNWAVFKNSLHKRSLFLLYTPLLFSLLLSFGHYGLEKTPRATGNLLTMLAEQSCPWILVVSSICCLTAVQWVSALSFQDLSSISVDGPTTPGLPLDSQRCQLLTQSEWII